MLDIAPQSYLYSQYADDPDMQAFIAAYNTGAQTLQDWFWQNLLPYWPGLTGDLLDWCAEGIYGLPRTSIASAVSSALGPLNTEALNTAALDSFVPGTQQVFGLTDDLFQRILTWHLYRADGRNFNVRWLKRRIMRFLVGTNGMDPQPEQPGFTVGCENTEAISVSFAAGVCEVIISQTLLSLLAPLNPGVLAIFQDAFQGGSLELPLQYSYQVTTASPFAAVVLPPTVSITGLTATLRAGPATASAAGNVGAITYLWSWESGGAGISIDEPGAAATTFTANNMLAGQTRTGVAQCLVTDAAANRLTVLCAVSIAHF
jgi:hypothetical protein